MKKIIFISILFLGFSSVSFSQSKKAIQKMEKKATELVEKLNKEITKGNESLALSDEQKEKIAKIHFDRFSAFKKLDKDASKEEKKKFNKTYFSKIFKEVLTKEQIKARKKGKEK